ncbi:MAG: hypothetical protein ACK6D7_02245 [Acidobacteriota bacterium]
MKPLFLLGAALAVCPASGWAQGMTCTTTPPAASTMRQGGVAELAGDIVINCTGGTPVTSGAFPTVNISMFFNTAVTSRIVAATTPPISEAVLLVDNPAPAVQAPCATPVCNNTDNIFQGRFESFNSLSWSNIPLNPPGPNSTRVLRFKNVRLNTNSLPSSGAAIVFLSVTGSTITNFVNPQQTVGTVRTGVTAELRNAAGTAVTGPQSFVTCTGNNVELAGNPGAQYSSPGGRSLLLTFSEATGSPNAFKKRNAATTPADPGALGSQNEPLQNLPNESGFSNLSFPTTNGLNRVGVADTGTILRAVFSNIPANVRLFVTARETAAGSTLNSSGIPTVTARLTANSNLPFVAVPASSTADGGLVPVPASGEVNWEVLENDVLGLESVSFGVVVAFSGSPQPTAGTINILSGLGPQGGSASATTTDQIPRHVVTSTPLPVFVFNPCRTTLLFQFLTNQAGFDTGVSVVNSSRDTLGTLPQTGRCTSTFFPTPFNAATQAQFPPLAGPVLQGGEQWTFTVSSARPNFQGYMMVNCEFQFAHGYAFISDFGSTKLAQGYQALVVPDRARVADPMTTAGSGSGEQLVH